jgi:glycosyltransferase involved in cell wall biosynthesis
MSVLKLSVITINYNNQKGLAKTMESVAAQRWQQFEYVVIDGGSIDGSKDLITGNQRINYYISENDKGVYHAMNKGIQAAKGDYIIFMNSGDCFYDAAVLEDVQSHFHGEHGVIYGNSVFVNDAGYREEKFPPAKVSFGHFIHDGLNHQAVFIKRSLFFKHFLYNESYKLNSDWEFFIYVLCKENEPYLYINRFICFYDFTGFSSSLAVRNSFDEERAATMRKYFPLMTEDAEKLEVLRTKRMQEVMYIRKHPVAWRLLKWMMDLLLLFLPKPTKR